MRHLISISISTALLLLLSSNVFTQDSVRPLNERVNSGHTLFHMKGCSNCHSLLNKGSPAVGPNLSRITVWASPVLGAAVMWNHVPLMAEAFKISGDKWPRFQGEEITDIFTYLNSLNQRDGDAIAFRANVTYGKSYFEEIGCQRCHGKPFTGGHYGPDLGKTAHQLRNVNEFSTRMLRHAPLMIKRAKAEGLAWPRLNGHQISSIYAYLKSLPVSRRF